QKKMRRPLDFEIDELKEIVIEEKKPVQTSIGGYTFFAAPAPFSGETTLQILKAMNEYDVPAVWEGNVKDLLETFKITRNSYAHRFHHIGDPGFVEASKGLEEDVIEQIATNEKFEIIEDDEPISTTHFS